jgi:eukaryotic-like serine/threonine-protein kinase
MDSDKPFSPDSAEAVWRRAAQLQSEAAQRSEERSRALSASPSADNPHDLSIDEVRAAASEVGISPEFVALAIAEMRADPAGELPEKLQDKATRFLGTPERMLERSRIVERPITDVYTAMQRVLPALPYALSLRDATGDPLAGGQLVFMIPELQVLVDKNPTPLSYNAYAVDVQQLQFMLRPVAGSNGQATEILLRAGLQRSVRRNFKFGSWTARVMAAIGAGGGGALGLFALGLSAPMIIVPAAAGAALLGGGTVLGYRKSYRYYMRKFTDILDEMLGALAVHAKTGGSFAAPVTPSLPLPDDS